MENAFIDSAVLIAAFHRRDADHRQGLEIVRAADEEKIPPLVLTDYVLAETLNFVNRRGGSDMARESLGRIEASRGLELERVPESVYLAAKDDVFHAVPGLSFVDATIVAYMNYRGLKRLYSFDGGFDRVPEIERLVSLDGPPPSSFRP